MPPESLQIQAAAELELRRRKRERPGGLKSQPATSTGIEPVTPQTVQPLPFVSDPSPGAAFPTPEPNIIGRQPLNLAGLVSGGFSAAGFDPTTDEQVAAQGLPGEGALARGLGTTSQVLANIVKGGIRGPVEFGAGLIDALDIALREQTIDPIVEQAKGLVKFIPEQVETVGTALGAKRVDPTGEITGISQRTGLVTREPIAPTEEEVAGARRELREHPEAPIFAALLGRGVSKGIAKRARPKARTIEEARTEALKVEQPPVSRFEREARARVQEPPTPEQKAVTEFFEAQPKPSVTLPEKPAKEIAKVTEVPKIEVKKPVTPLPKLKEAIVARETIQKTFKEVADQPAKIPVVNESLNKVRLEARTKETKSPSIKNLKPEAFEDLGDFVIWGSDKIAKARKGTFKRGQKPPPADFNKFSQDMVFDFGENIRPHTPKIFDEAVRTNETIAPPLLTKNNARPTQATINTIKKTFTDFVDRAPASIKSSGKIDLKRRLQKEGVKVEVAEPTIDGQRISTFKDIKATPAQFNTFPRNMRKVLGKERADRLFIDGFDNAKGAMVEMSMTLLRDLESTIQAPVKRGGLGIQEHSKLSRRVQEFGEELKTYDEILKELGKEKAARVVKAAAWFRNKYDILIDELNATMEMVYPNQPQKLIAKRKDYFRHFQELSEGFLALRQIIETPSEIAPSLAGISEFTRPFMKFLSIAQRRAGNKTRVDAVGGFKNYIPQAAYATKITPQIKNLRNFASEMRAASQEFVDQTGARPPLNRYIKYIDRMANQLAGKKGPWDRALLEDVPGGRGTLNVLSWANRRVAANAILANLGALSFGMPANIVNAAGVLKMDLARGATSSIASLFDKKHPIRKSRHWREVNLPLEFNKFNRRWLQDPVKNTGRFLGWTIDVANKVVGFPIWNAAYNKALRDGIKNPSRFADNTTRDLMGGRGIGEKPLAFTEETKKLFLNFQLEVTNAWYVLKDRVSERDFAGLAIALTAAWGYNRMAEEVRGNKVVFDPFDAIMDGYDTFNDPQSDESTGTRILRAGGRVAGEVLSNLPLGQVAGAAYPSGGIEGLPTRKELFGAEDPTRFGTGVLIEKAISDPLFSLLPPFAGQQIKKTVGGVRANIAGEVRSKSGERQLFTVPSDLETRLKNVLFGKWSTPAAREYFDKRKPRKSDVSRGRLRKKTIRKKTTRSR